MKWGEKYNINALPPVKKSDKLMSLNLETESNQLFSFNLIQFLDKVLLQALYVRMHVWVCC